MNDCFIHCLLIYLFIFLFFADHFYNCVYCQYYHYKFHFIPSFVFQLVGHKKSPVVCGDRASFVNSFVLLRMDTIRPYIFFINTIFIFTGHTIPYRLCIPITCG